MASDLALTTASQEGVRIIHVQEERLDARRAVDFKERLVREAENEAEVLIIDLAEVRFMDSSGLGALVTGLKAVGRTGTMVLCGVQEKVQELLHMTHMDRVFSTYSDVEEALAALR